MPGLEKISTASCGWEHQDKGRLEPNFVIPNMELQSGKRPSRTTTGQTGRELMPGRRWLITHYGLHDPNAPENRRILTLP